MTQSLFSKVPAAFLFLFAYRKDPEHNLPGKRTTLMHVFMWVVDYESF